MIKICTKCGLARALNDYYPHPTGADGYTRTCKICKRAHSTQYRIELKGDSPSTIRKYHSRYLDKFPMKRKAHTALNNAVRDGRVAKGVCEVCGTSDNVHGHHDAYLKRLDVRWLCAIHHKEWHSENGEAKNA